MRVRLIATVMAALLLASSAMAAGPLTPLVVGWEQFFKLNWSVGERRGKPVVTGTIYNNWGFTAANVRLLVDELDANGQIVEQRVGWLGFTLTPGTTAPFEVPVAHATPNHRVSVFAFDWVQAGDRGRNRF